MWHSFTLKILTLLVSFTCSHGKTIGGAEAEARRRRRRRAEVEALTRGGERAEADALRRTGGGRRRGEVVFFRQRAAAFSGGLCRGVRGVGREGRGGERSGGEVHAARRHSRSGGWRTKGANVRRRKTVRGGWLRSLRRGVGGGDAPAQGIGPPSTPPTPALSSPRCTGARGVGGGRGLDSCRDQILVAIK